MAKLPEPPGAAEMQGIPPDIVALPAGWSRAIHEAYPGVCGLLYASSMNGNRPAVALYERAARAVPAAPDFNRPLSDAALLLPLERIASGLGYDLV